MIQHFKKQNKWLGLLALLVVLGLSAVPPDLQPDSPGYIHGSETRGLLYPAFLHVMAWFFGEWYVPVVVLQIVAGIAAILYTVYKVTNWFQINRMVQTVLFVIMLLPYIGHTRIGNTILTEPLCYPLFMMYFVHLFASVVDRNKKSFYISVAVACLMMLTRKQFGLFFAGFYFVVALEYLAYKRFDICKWIVPVVVFALSVCAEYSYVYHKTGEFKETPFVVQYIAAPLFIAKPENIEQLHDPKQKAFLTAALKERDKMGVGLSDPFRSGYDFVFPPQMRFEIVHDFYRFRATPVALDAANIPISERDSLITKISFNLIKLNFFDYMRVYSSTLIHALGGYYPCASLGLIFLMSTFCFIRFQQSVLLFISLATFLQFLNYGIVSLMQPIIRRFVIYTDTFYLISVFLLLTLLYNYLKKENSCKLPS